MKAIYFGKQKNKPSVYDRYGKPVLEWGTEKLTKNFPDTSLKISESILCSPHRPKNAGDSPIDFEVHDIDVFGKKVRLYSKGESDKALLFIHGWSGSARNFKSFYKRALDQGYSVWGIDHVGHGDSEGKYSNFIYFVEGVKQAFQYVRARKNIAGVIGHSMGASAVVSAGLPSDIKTVLLSPVIPLFENMYDLTREFGISRKMVDHLFESIENRLARQIEELNPVERWKFFKNPRIIFHDVEDQFIPLEKNLKYIDSGKEIGLNITQGLGHFRILKDSALIHQSLEFLEDQTD
jgi:pimeloyl-ACP methyl ester carboxylesterase